MVNIVLGCIVIATISMNVFNLNGQVLSEEKRIAKSLQNEKELNVELKRIIEDHLEQLEDIAGMTSQNKVLEVNYKDKQVTVNLHRDMIGYKGGTHTEYILGALIMEAVFENSDAETLTILVDGKEDKLPEGSRYIDCTRQNYETYYQTIK